MPCALGDRLVGLMVAPALRSDVLTGYVNYQYNVQQNQALKHHCIVWFRFGEQTVLNVKDLQRHKHILVVGLIRPL